MVREPTIKPTLASSRVFRLAVDSMPAPGDYDQGLDLGGLAELFNHNSQGEAGPVDQQPDDDLGATLFSSPVTHPPETVPRLGLEVERGHACGHWVRPLVVVTRSNGARERLSR